MVTVITSEEYKARDAADLKRRGFDVTVCVTPAGHVMLTGIPK